jgi:hypothetical protein
MLMLLLVLLLLLLLLLSAFHPNFDLRGELMPPRQPVEAAVKAAALILCF